MNTNEKPRIAIHFHRYEMKYLFPSNVRDGIIPVLLQYMDFDDFGKSFPENAYPVLSLYFDTPGLSSYYEKINGLRSRKKLRIRFYSRNFSDNTPVFLEIKRKYDAVVVKDRLSLTHRECFDLIHSLKIPKNFANARDESFVNEFLWLKLSSGMIPQNIVLYKRMAFVSKINPRFRVTLDDDIETHRADWIQDERNGVRVSPGYTVLEVKFDSILPAWFHKILVSYNLERVAFSKYCNALEVLRPELVEREAPLALQFSNRINS